MGKFIFHKPEESSLAEDVAAGIFLAAMFYGMLYFAIFIK